MGLGFTYTIVFQEEMMRGKPGYEHLNEPLHILVEAELPVDIIDARLMQAREILQDLLKPVVCHQHHYPLKTLTCLLLVHLEEPKPERLSSTL
jgi:hypothetical protein